MRDPKRIYKLLDKLAILWFEMGVDLRFGQLIMNIVPSGFDPFYIEDDVIIKLIERKIRELEDAKKD